eukprot:11730789-Ditylum_brightwellii.AAC.1
MGILWNHTTATNSRFDSKDFINSCKEDQQSYSYCGIGGHHQNGIAENTNKCLTHNAIIILLHTKREWPAVAEERHNKLDLNANGMLPLEQLLGHKEELMASNFHTWGCPVFFLDSRSQSNTVIGPPK